MKSRFKTFQWDVVSVNKSATLPGPSLILTKAVSLRTVLHCSSRTDAEPIGLDPDATVLIAGVEKTRLVSRDGAWRYLRLSLDSMMKLCAFLDQGAGVDAQAQTSKELVAVRLPEGIGSKNLEPWLIGAVLSGDPRVQRLRDELQETVRPKLRLVSSQ